MVGPNVRMIDIGSKAESKREATARGTVLMQASTFEAVKLAKLPKGDALAVAKIAGIMAAKSTPSLLPMCHPLLIEDISMDFELDEKASSIEIISTVRGSGKTGYEMEAMTAVSVSALTLYDMCKSIDATVKINNIRLARKSGGKSGTVIIE